MEPRTTPGIKPKKGGSPLLSGIIVGILLAMVWLALAWLTHAEISVAAWGIGALIGVTLAKSTGKPDPSLGMVAAALTVGAVLLAKVLIVVVALPQMARDEIRRNPETTTKVFVVDMLRHRSFSPELQVAIDSQRERPDNLSRRGEDLTYRMMDEARARAKAAGRPEVERVIRMNTDTLIAKVGFVPILGSLFGVLDLLWLGLGVASAWQLARAGWVT